MTQKLANEKIKAKMPSADDRPEIELLLCCARTYVDTATAERIENLLQKDIDWAYLIHTANNHGVMPLLYWSLNATCPEAVPKVILDQLRNHFHSNALHNVFLTKELILLLNLLEVHGIPAIPYRGPVLAASVYNNLSLRQFSDLDILVHSRDFLKTKDLLISQGYQLIEQHSWEHHFVHEESMVNVDLHQGIAHSNYFPSLDFERLWERISPLSLTGAIVPNLLPEEKLLFLCMQFFKDCWEWDGRGRLAQICDIAELVRIHQKMDWVCVMEQAGALGIRRILFLGLFLARDLLGTALPDQVSQRMQSDVVVQAIALQVRQRLFFFRKVNGLPKFFKRFFFYIRARERLQDRVRYYLPYMAPSQEDLAFLPLPPPLYFLYYLIRPPRLVGKYSLRLLRRFSVGIRSIYKSSPTIE